MTKEEKLKEIEAKKGAIKAAYAAKLKRLNLAENRLEASEKKQARKDRARFLILIGTVYAELAKTDAKHRDTLTKELKKQFTKPADVTLIERQLKILTEPVKAPEVPKA